MKQIYTVEIFSHTLPFYLMSFLLFFFLSFLNNRSVTFWLFRIGNRTVENRPVLGGGCYLTDKEVSAQLKLSRRTLQDYRNEGRISYYQLGGKILYRESDIEKMLQESYQGAYRVINKRKA